MRRGAIRTNSKWLCLKRVVDPKVLKRKDAKDPAVLESFKPRREAGQLARLETVNKVTMQRTLTQLIV
jgi:hypothetical protein